MIDDALARHPHDDIGRRKFSRSGWNCQSQHHRFEPFVWTHIPVINGFDQISSQSRIRNESMQLFRHDKDGRITKRQVDGRRISAGRRMSRQEKEKLHQHQHYQRILDGFCMKHVQSPIVIPFTGRVLLIYQYTWLHIISYPNTITSNPYPIHTILPNPIQRAFSEIYRKSQSF